jgi:hypothetical protein
VATYVSQNMERGKSSVSRLTLLRPLQVAHPNIFHVAFYAMNSIQLFYICNEFHLTILYMYARKFPDHERKGNERENLFHVIIVLYAESIYTSDCEVTLIYKGIYPG